MVVVDTSAGGDETARQLRERGGRGHPARALGRGPLRARRARRRRRRCSTPTKGLAPATRREHRGGAREAHRARDAAARPTSARCSSPRSTGSTAASSRRSSTSATARPPRARRAPTRCSTGCAARSRARARASSRWASGRDAHHELLAELSRAGGGHYSARRRRRPGDRPGAPPHERDQDADDHRPRRRPRRGARPALLLRDGQALARRGARPARAHAPRAPREGDHQGPHGGQGLRQGVPAQRRVGRRHGLVPRLWAAEYVRRLLGSGGVRGRQPGQGARARPRRTG